MFEKREGIITLLIIALGLRTINPFNAAVNLN